MTDATGSPPRGRSEERERMVRRQLVRRGLSAEDVLEAMRAVPRHRFVPSASRNRAYQDRALPIGHGATISQPYMVGLMTEELEVEPGAKVLEIGTGSGYQAAVLAELGADVWTIERIPDLAEAAREALEEQGYDDVRVLVRDGSGGFPREAPFDRILVTAAAPSIPDLLVDQLAEGGILLVPSGKPGIQTLYKIRKTPDGETEREEITGCAFVPLVGEHGFADGSGRRSIPR